VPDHITESLYAFTHFVIDSDRGTTLQSACDHVTLICRPRARGVPSLLAGLGFARDKRWNRFNILALGLIFQEFQLHYTVL
jgi:hypothetical protein